MATIENIQKVLMMAVTAQLAGAPNEITEQTVKLYYHTLQDIPGEVLEAAVLDHLSRSPFWPRISELRATACNISSGIDEYPPAAEAWGEVCAVLNGRYGLPSQLDLNKVFGHNPLCLRAVNALGWRSLRESTNQVADRARFIEAYQQYRQRAQHESVTLPVIQELTARLRMPELPEPEPMEVLQDANADLH